MMYGRGYNGFNSCIKYGFGFMNSGIGMLLMLVFILILTIGVIFFVSRNNRHKLSNDTLVALKIRLAKGEISEDEYIRRKNIID